MPLVRCTDDECDFQEFRRSQLMLGCPYCGEEVELVAGYEEDDDAPRIPGRPATPERADAAAARRRARALLNDHRANTLPVPVRAIARREGLTIEDDVDLGPSLRARLVNRTIQLREEREYLKRFSIAHELGHWILGSRHGDGPEAETEADAFAGELLVPGPQLLAALRTTRRTADLAKLFQVSYSVIEIAAKTHQKSDLLEN